MENIRFNQPIDYTYMMLYQIIVKLYVKDMLQSNRLWDKSLEKFVIQDVKSALPTDIQKVTKVITDLAHRFNYAITGGKEIKKQSLKRRLNRRRKIQFIL